jgi:hypothetical protein
MFFRHPWRPGVIRQGLIWSTCYIQGTHCKYHRDSRRIAVLPSHARQVLFIRWGIDDNHHGLSQAG